jgi:glutamate/tyrosine decarboxylase-like PLP-dependent enzyme
MSTVPDDDLRSAITRAARIAADYRDSLREARAGAVSTRGEIAAALDGALQDGPTSVDDVLDELVRVAAPGLTSSAGPRYFGFVTGGALDAAVVAEVVAAGWDQNAFNEVMSPAGVAFEGVAGRWLKELLGLPAGASVGFVTGCQAANTVGLAAGRWSVLERHGWDVGRDGLNAAPPIRVVAGAERHATIDRALRLLGLGDRSLVEVPALPSGAMDVAALARTLETLDGGPVIVCAQSGNVNTGACDDLTAVTAAADEVGAWVHVDGAFGLWAAASPRTARLTEGLEHADSWACDGHKWLNVPYDVGYAFCAHPEAHATALAYTASYLTGQIEGRTFGGGDLVPESSRRARGFATWAALRSLGTSGVADLVDRCCALARRFADGLAALDGVDVVNEVVLNQVLVRVGDTEVTDRLERAIQRDGVAWLGATTWRGERLLRISVSNWSTTEADVDEVVAAIGRMRDEVVRGPG